MAYITIILKMMPKHSKQLMTIANTKKNNETSIKKNRFWAKFQNLGFALPADFVFEKMKNNEQILKHLLLTEKLINKNDFYKQQSDFYKTNQ